MADQNLPAEKPTTDIVGRDADDLQAYMDAGMPNIGSIQPDNIMRMFEMYVSGKNYIQISNIMRCPKVAVLFLSHKHNWFEKRSNYMEEMMVNNERKMVEAKLTSQQFLMDWNQAEQKRMQKHVDQYLATGDEKHLDKINGKALDRWMKGVELLNKSGAAADKAKAPLVGINVGDGATLTRTGDNTIEVTPKQKAMTGMLKELANQRRAEEKKRDDE